MLRKVEWAVAIVLTLLAAGLHLVFLRHGGALWRDEAGAINLAEMPRFSDVWAHLHYDSFPLLWVLVARAWAALGFAGDFALRFLGFIIGLAGLAALWFNARAFKISFPLLSLLLIGLSPTIIVWGDSMRAWGWGVLWILLTLGLVWRVVESPTAGRIVLAALAAIISVQSTYHNAVLLFAICAGGIAVAFRRRSWKSAAAILGVGTAAAISLLPYRGVFRRGADEYIVLRTQFGLAQYVAKLADAIRIPGTPIVLAWLLLVLAAVSVALFSQFRPQIFKVTPAQRDLLLFSLVTLTTAVAGFFVFLNRLALSTLPWYYAALLAVAAVALDIMLSVLANVAEGGKTRLAFVIVVLGLIFVPANRQVRIRLTNADVVAQTLSASAHKGDLIVLNPWFCGISFQRYYTGTAAWTGLPDVKDYRVHRYDTIKDFIMMPDPSAPAQALCERMRDTLKSGHRLWLVTGPIPAGSPDRLMSAPTGPSGWIWGYYGAGWSHQVAIFLDAHVTGGHEIQLPPVGVINPLEDMKLIVTEGWREN
jgi:hypothetical protein